MQVPHCFWTFLDWVFTCICSVFAVLGSSDFHCGSGAGFLQAFARFQVLRLVSVASHPVSHPVFTLLPLCTLTFLGGVGGGDASCTAHAATT